MASLLDRVERGERVTITRHGRDVALLVPPATEPGRTTDAAVTALLEFRRGRRLGSEHRGRIDGAGSARFMELVLSLPIAVDPVSRSRAFSVTYALARIHGLSASDAAYLEVALREGMPMATLDARLRSAAQAEGVPLFG